jgi:hypothetical protein
MKATNMHVPGRRRTKSKDSRLRRMVSGIGPAARRRSHDEPARGRGAAHSIAATGRSFESFLEKETRRAIGALKR